MQARCFGRYNLWVRKLDVLLSFAASSWKHPGLLCPSLTVLNGMVAAQYVPHAET